jgi:hypothetical protein
MVENHRHDEELLTEPKLNHAGLVAQAQTNAFPGPPGGIQVARTLLGDWFGEARTSIL